MQDEAPLLAVDRLAVLRGGLLGDVPEVAQRSSRRAATMIESTPSAVLARHAPCPEGELRGRDGDRHVGLREGPQLQAGVASA